VSTLQLAYGNYVHAVGECELKFDRIALSGDSGNPYAERISVEIAGVLVGDGVRDMNVKCANLIAAYSRNGFDFQVIDENGTLQRLSIISSQTLAGVQIVAPPSFPTNKDAAYVTYLPYRIALTADVPIYNPETVLVKWQESLSFSGGGPEFVYLETRFGRPQKQGPTRNKVYKAVQEGSAVGLYITPTAPDQIWPQSLMRAPKIRSIGGRLVGAGSNRRYMYKGLRWRYEYESADPFFGTPNHWGTV